MKKQFYVVVVFITVFLFFQSHIFRIDCSKELKWLRDIKYDKAIYYNYNCSEKCKDSLVCDFQIIDSLNVLANTVEIPGIELKFKSAKEIINLVTRNKFYKSKGIEEGTGCYTPISAIVFYSSLQKPLASINFSQDCFQIEIINYNGYTVYHKYFYELGKEKLVTIFKREKLKGC
ncbi:MAG: hypothetical protein L6Q66_01370 [Bacteroidia bacterium]|nr:hypothetical protein [Bacteroidia bacterium]